MEYPKVRRRKRTSGPAKGVYADLDDLIRLQFKARGFGFLPRQPVHSILSGRYASRIRGRGFDFEEIRRYLPGDDVRSIDWKVTARMRKPHTRVFTEERDRPTLLLVDQRIGMFFGTRVRMKSVVAAEAAALAAWRVVDAGDRVGALVFNDSSIVEVRPHRSEARVMRILEAVVEMNHALSVNSDATPNLDILNRVLDQAVRLAKHDYLVVVISDFDGADEETRRHFIRIAAHNDLLGVLVHDPSATEIPSAGDMVVTDGELQVQLRLGSERVRKSVESMASGRMSQLLGWQREIGVPMLPINTVEDVAEQVRSLMGRAGTGGR
ncbi:MAG: DUF58 domain-containing protein [Candidatus Eisenbacteria bacterium]|nr:DUF58 domain-containing protein [Candidatus Eisenbacteria bacterium]